MAATRLGLAGLLFLAICGIAQPQEAEPITVVTPKPIAVILPGTVVNDKDIPKGYTHLVIKSYSKIGAGDIESVGDTYKELASFLFAVITANVENKGTAGQSRYRLKEVAFGLGTKINEKDIIISSSTQSRLGADLGFLKRLGLSRAEARIPGMIVLARTDTMALIDAPTHLFRKEKHREVLFRNAVLIDPKTGNQELLVWLIDKNDKGEPAVEGPMEWMPTGRINNIVLHVDANEFVAGLITEKALAMSRLTQGERTIPMPKEVQGIAAKNRLTKEELVTLETKLREAIKAR